VIINGIIEFVIKKKKKKKGGLFKLNLQFNNYKPMSDSVSCGQELMMLEHRAIAIASWNPIFIYRK
jgi:hypothetical protein